MIIETKTGWVDLVRLDEEKSTLRAFSGGRTWLVRGRVAWHPARDVVYFCGQFLRHDASDGLVDANDSFKTREPAALWATCTEVSMSEEALFFVENNVQWRWPFEGAAIACDCDNDGRYVINSRGQLYWRARTHNISAIVFLTPHNIMAFSKAREPCLYHGRIISMREPPFIIQSCDNYDIVANGTTLVLSTYIDSDIRPYTDIAGKKLAVTEHHYLQRSPEGVWLCYRGPVPIGEITEPILLVPMAEVKEGEKRFKMSNE